MTAKPKRMNRSDEVEAPRRDALDTTFDIALILKGLDGLLELVGGPLLLMISV